jgi:hypothetical protein
MICYRRLLGCQDENILLIRYYFVKTLLGLVPEAFEHGLRIVRIDVSRICVGKSRADLGFERGSDGAY